MQALSPFELRHRDPWVAADPLSEVFHYLRVSGVFTCRSELRAPFGLFIPEMPGCWWFHAVVSGECHLSVPSAPRSVTLRSGSFALVPHGVGHRIATDDCVPAPSVIDLPQEMVSPRYSILRHGGQGDPCLLICGAVQIAHPLAGMIASALPPILLVEARNHALRSPLEGALDLLAQEAPAIRPGGETVITRLAEVIAVQLLRAWIEEAPAASEGLLGALRDPRLGRALALVHRATTPDVDLETLARTAGMSRSAFSAKFRGLVGLPVIKYVTRARMHVADELLREGRTIAEVAEHLGYRSEAAFARAFKRVTGESPGRARRAGVGPP